MAFAVVRKGSRQEAFVFGDRGQAKVAVVTHEGFYVPSGWHGDQNDSGIYDLNSSGGTFRAKVLEK